MPTTTMNISLPEALKKYVRERVIEEHYSNPSDYIRALIREDQKRRAEQTLERLLLEGLASGGAAPATAEEFEDLRREVRAHIARRQRRQHA